jgi:Tol biopolymer transport system component
MRLATVAADGTNLRDIPLGNITPLWPSACGDGKRIVFVGSSNSADFLMWRADVDGANSKQLTAEHLDGVPSCSPDGKFILYNQSGDNGGLMRMPIDGGASTRITKEVVMQAQASPDLKSAAGFISPDASKPPKIAIVDLASGEIRNVYDLPADVVWMGDGGHKLEWAKDGRSVLYETSKDETPELWAQPVGAKGAAPLSPKRIAILPQETNIWAFTVSPDGKQIAYSRGQNVTDAVLISHFH